MSTISKTAAEILGNPAYQAICYGGYRAKSREIQPTIPQLKEDLRILSAMGIKLLRTYNVHYAEASNLLQAIREIKREEASFEMYLMLGAWIDCKNAWTDQPVRIRKEDSPRNAAEIARAVDLTQQYPDIVKIIAVGNEAMVQWAQEYYVEPGIILRWVRHLQDLKAKGELPAELWITSSDNFAAWGGGDSSYQVEDLSRLIKAVDFISVHTYPMHDTHYNPDFWGIAGEEAPQNDLVKVRAAMKRSIDYAIGQYESVRHYLMRLHLDKPIHIGETGWATQSNEHYGPEGSKATDEYKSALYYQLMREWTNAQGITCFYFEAFDEPWKDAANPTGSENHFGLFNPQAQAKYALWDLVGRGVFDGLTRDGFPITKTHEGDQDALLKTVLLPNVNPKISAIHSSAQ